MVRSKRHDEAQGWRLLRWLHGKVWIRSSALSPKSPASEALIEDLRDWMKLRRYKKFSFVLHCNFRRRGTIRVQDTDLFVISVSLLFNTVLKMQKLTWKKKFKIRTRSCQQREGMRDEGGDDCRWRRSETLKWGFEPNSAQLCHILSSFMLS